MAVKQEFASRFAKRKDELEWLNYKCAHLSVYASRYTGFLEVV